MGIAKVAAPPLGGNTKLVIQSTSIQTFPRFKTTQLWSASQARNKFNVGLGMIVKEGG